MRNQFIYNILKIIFFYTIVLQKLPVIFLKLTRYILKVLIIYTLHTVPFNYYSIKVYV